MIACLLNIVAALKIWKWLTLPYILYEGFRLVVFFAAHVLLMMVFKKQLNLGVLIAASCFGGFCLLLLGYMWGCSIALFQIITNSKEYQRLNTVNSPVTVKLQKNVTISSINLNRNLLVDKNDEKLISTMLVSDFSEFYQKPPIYQY